MAAGAVAPTGRPGSRRSEFALLRTSAGALVALPVPFPAGWRRYGVAGSDGGAWTVD
ncbi:hypothetical protein [Gemmatimonas sp.]|uniref:hypothetical protein n=1 Tax=Gemmatimonas sp. TaxID=1962908 RepID=UPI003DA42784